MNLVFRWAYGPIGDNLRIMPRRGLDRTTRAAVAALPLKGSLADSSPFSLA